MVHSNQVLGLGISPFTGHSEKQLDMENGKCLLISQTAHHAVHKQEISQLRPPNVTSSKKRVDDIFITILLSASGNDLI